MKVIFSIIPKEIKIFRSRHYGGNSQSSGETHEYRCAGAYKPPPWGSSESPASGGFIARDDGREDRALSTGQVWGGFREKEHLCSACVLTVNV